mgnify:CR=1 FL=1
MGKLSLAEKLAYSYTHGEEMPLKGHVRLVLEDIRDGSQKVVEGDNLITNAVGSLLSKNWDGCVRFDRIFPLKSLYGGCLMFQNAMTGATANDFNPPSESANPMIAHAGSEAPASGWTDKRRGAPVLPDYVETANSIKMVWLWDNTQGIGTINTVCLCPDTLGNSGLAPCQDTYNLFSGMSDNDNGNNNTTFDETIAQQYPVWISSDGKTSKSVFASGTTFKEINVRHDYFAHGLMRDRRTWDKIDERSATIRTFGTKTFWVQDASYYYVIEAQYDSQESKYGFRIDKISKETFAVTQADVYYDTITLWTGNLDDSGRSRKSSLEIFAFDGTYLYYPDSAGTSWVKCNLSDNSDKLTLNNTLTIDKGYSGASGSTQFHNPICISSGLVLGHNYILNGDSAYQTKRTQGVIISDNNLDRCANAWAVRNGTATYWNGKQTYYNYYYAGQGGVLCKMFLSSIYGLENEVHKGANQTMRLEYTIAEETT